MARHQLLTVTVRIPRKMNRSLHKWAASSKRSFDAVVRECLELGEEHLMWVAFTDGLIKLSKEAQKQPGLTRKDRQDIKRNTLSIFAQTVSRAGPAASKKKGRRQ